MLYTSLKSLSMVNYGITPTSRFTRATKIKLCKRSQARATFPALQLELPDTFGEDLTRVMVGDKYDCIKVKVRKDNTRDP